MDDIVVGRRGKRIIIEDWTGVFFNEKVKWEWTLLKEKEIEDGYCRLLAFIMFRDSFFTL